MPELVIGAERFASKADAERRIRVILDRYARTAGMEPLRGADLQFVQALIAMHPRAADIIDCGVDRIVVQRIPFQEHLRRFVAIRRDGSWRDFSWRKCLSPRAQLAQVRAVCRRIVRPQIEAFRRRFWSEHPHGAVCPVLGIPMTPETAHVDHAPPPFEALVDRWLACERIDADEIEFVYRRDYGEHTLFADPGLEQSWADYHRINARLRMVSARANLSTLRRRHDAA
jgi:hypothetical protein